MAKTLTKTVRVGHTQADQYEQSSLEITNDQYGLVAYAFPKGTLAWELRLENNVLGWVVPEFQTRLGMVSWVNAYCLEMITAGF